MGENIVHPSELSTCEFEVVEFDRLFDSDCIVGFEEFDQEHHCVELDGKGEEIKDEGSHHCKVSHHEEGRDLVIGFGEEEEETEEGVYQDGSNA